MKPPKFRKPKKTYNVFLKKTLILKDIKRTHLINLIDNHLKNLEKGLGSEITSIDIKIIKNY
jgi:hypothetical protein